MIKYINNIYLVYVNSLYIGGFMKQAILILNLNNISPDTINLFIILLICLILILLSGILFYTKK